MSRRTILVLFQLGLSGIDVDKLLAMIRFICNNSVDRNLTRNTREIMLVIQEEYDVIINNAMKYEIIETLWCEKKDELSSKEMILLIKMIKNNDLDNLPDEVRPLLLPVACNMG